MLSLYQRNTLETSIVCPLSIIAANKEHVLHTKMLRDKLRNPDLPNRARLLIRTTLHSKHQKLQNRAEQPFLMQKEREIVQNNCKKVVEESGI